MNDTNLELKVEKVIVDEIITSIKINWNTTAVSFTGVQGSGKRRIGLDLKGLKMNE